MTDQNIGPLSKSAQHTMRPLRNAIFVGAALIVAGFLLNNLSPDLFRSLGGWVTLIVLLAVSAITGTFVTVRRMARRSAMPDEFSEPPQD
jgi:hypothetical protein